MDRKEKQRIDVFAVRVRDEEKEYIKKKEYLDIYLSVMALFFENQYFLRW